MSLQGLGDNFRVLLDTGARVAVVEPVHPELHVRLELPRGSFKDEVYSPDDGCVNGFLSCEEESQRDEREKNMSA